MLDIYVLTNKLILVIKHRIPMIYYAQPNKLSKKEGSREGVESHLEGETK